MTATGSEPAPGRGLPLQPRGEFWSPGLRRLALILALAAGVLALGWLAPARSRPPQLVLGGPGHEGDYARSARQLIDGARERLRVAVFVVRPDDGVVGGLLEALAAARARGVDVRVLLDRGAGFDGQPDRKHEAPEAWLRARGIDVRCDGADRTMHAKVLVADGRRILAGSHNWTRSASVSNGEVSWLVEDAQAAAQLEAWMDSLAPANH